MERKGPTEGVTVEIEVHEAAGAVGQEGREVSCGGGGEAVVAEVQLREAPAARGSSRWGCLGVLG